MRSEKNQTQIDNPNNPELQDEFYDPYEHERQFCDVCGHEIIPYERGHCPACYGCGESYAPGSEECDWCPFSDECASWEKY